MSVTMWTQTAVSMLGLVLLLALWASRSGNWRLFSFQAVSLIAFASFLYWLFPLPPTVDYPNVFAEGEFSGAFVAALYVCMLVGMMAQFLHRHFERPKRRRRKFDWGLFVAPVFASPIVFIPLLVAMQNADVDLTEMTTARFMIFVVAFQNGFFWKDYFDRRRKEIQTDEA